MGRKSELKVGQRKGATQKGRALAQLLCRTGKVGLELRWVGWYIKLVTVKDYAIESDLEGGIIIRAGHFEYTLGE